MAIEWFTEEWAAAWKAEISSSEPYRAAAKSWKWPVVVILQKDPAMGLPADRALYLDLFHGECRVARMATAEDIAAATYIISADATTWREVMERKLEPIAGLMRGRLKLTRGSRLALTPHVMSARELVNTATRISTSFSPMPA